MKELLVVRHANWDKTEDRLTDEGCERCSILKPKLGSLALVLSSPTERARETAKLLSGQEPAIDARAGILKSTPKQSALVADRLKTHPLGVAGAIISIPELREPLRQQGKALRGLVAETLEKLTDGQTGLIVSHDGTMIALKKVLSGETLDDLDHTYGELEGFRINEGLELLPLERAHRSS